MHGLLNGWSLNLKVPEKGAEVEVTSEGSEDCIFLDKRIKVS